MIYILLYVLYVILTCLNVSYQHWAGPCITCLWTVYLELLLSLIHMDDVQMEELLKEVALSEHRKKLVDSFVQQVTDFLQCVPESEVVEVRNMCGIYISSSKSAAFYWYSMVAGNSIFLNSFLFLSSWMTFHGCQVLKSHFSSSHRQQKANFTWSLLHQSAWWAVIHWARVSNPKSLWTWRLPFLLWVEPQKLLFWLSVGIYIYIYMSVSVYKSVCLSVLISVHQTVCVSVHLSACFSVCICLCQSVCLYMYIAVVLKLFPPP